MCTRPASRQLEACKASCRRRRAKRRARRDARCRVKLQRCPHVPVDKGNETHGLWPSESANQSMHAPVS